MGCKSLDKKKFQKTKNIFLESAYFNPAGVRRTARLHGIETDSAYRFSRGVNPEAVMLALNRASELLQTLAGGEVYSDPHDFYPLQIARRTILFDMNTATKSLGYTVDKKDFIQWMERLECDVKVEGELLKVQPPLYRWDISMDMDLVEEYSRLSGYDKIPETLPSIKAAPTKHDFEFTFLIISTPHTLLCIDQPYFPNCDRSASCVYAFFPYAFYPGIPIRRGQWNNPHRKRLHC